MPQTLPAVSLFQQPVSGFQFSSAEAAGLGKSAAQTGLLATTSTGPTRPQCPAAPPPDRATLWRRWVLTEGRPPHDHCVWTDRMGTLSKPQKQPHTPYSPLLLDIKEWPRLHNSTDRWLGQSSTVSSLSVHLRTFKLRSKSSKHPLAGCPQFSPSQQWVITLACPTAGCGGVLGWTVLLVPLFYCFSQLQSVLESPSIVFYVTSPLVIDT